MKLPLTISLIVLYSTAASQKITKYYDADWMPVTKDKAVYYADFVKKGDVYECTSRWINGNALRGKSIYADTIMDRPLGWQLLYSKNGRIEDSLFFNEKGNTEKAWHFYANGKLAAYYYLPEIEKPVAEGYDEEGKKIRNYVYQREAEFKGGEKAWQAYIKKNTSDLKVKGKDQEDVTASVEIKFVIDEDGSVTQAKVFKSSGYKEIDRDAVRIISESPSWINAVQYNQPVKAIRVQPFTYALGGEGKNKK